MKPVCVLLLCLFAVTPCLADDDDDELESTGGSWLQELLQRVGITSEAVDDDDDDDAEGSSRIVLYQGQAALRLDAEEQQVSDIGLHSVATVRQLLEDPATAFVVDLQPLLSLRARYSEVAADVSAATARLNNARQGLDGLRQLNREQGSVAARSLREAEAEMLVLRASQGDVRRQLSYLRDQAVHQWGEQIVDWALDTESVLFQRLLSREYVLLQVILRPGRKLADATSFVYVDSNNQRQQARKAYRISPAPQIVGSVQGETWYFRTHGEHLRTGMRLDVWVPQPEAIKEGVFIPADALIWHESRPWVYVCREQQYFIRTPLQRQRPYGNGWFVPAGIEAGEEVVVRGAQTLYSEEFKSAIPDEDDD